MAGRVNRRQRFRRIARLFLRLAVSFLVSYTRARALGRSYDFYGDREKNRTRARWIRDTALDMGGVIIKVGQFLSTRVDLLPDEYIEELALLQDEVPAVAWPEIRQAIEQAFGRSLANVFPRFDPVPLAAASLGQAHRAVLGGGQQVVVKVQRPDIEEIVSADLASLTFIVSWLNRWAAVRRRVNLPVILREFDATLRGELDYIAEAHHAERLGVALAYDERILIPRVYWSHTRSRVLTLEYMWGVKITDYASLTKAGIDRAELAETLLRAYLHQILIDGFFHADPHPGNLFARRGGQVILVDFGMVSGLTPVMRESVRQVFLGIVRRDFDAVVLALVRLGFVRPSADLRLVKHALVWGVDKFYGLSFAELQSVDPREVLHELEDVLRAEAFQVPANFAFLFRALGTLTGLCTGLDPSFQFVTVAEPFARRLISDQLSVSAIITRLVEEGRGLAGTAVRMPRLTRTALERVNEGELDLRRDLASVTAVMVRIDRAMQRLFYGMLVTALILASAAFIESSRLHPLAAVTLGLTGLVILRLVVLGRTPRV